MHVDVLPDDQRRAFPASQLTVEPEPTLDRFLTIYEVMKLTSLGKTAIYARIGRGQFPRPVPLSKTKVAWSARDIARWQGSLCKAREVLAA